MRLPDAGNLEINTFAQVLDDKYIQNSYKFYWLAALLEEISHNQTHISFHRLVCRMVAKSWYSLVQYRLNLGFQDKLYELVMLIKEKYGLRPDIPEEELIEFLTHHQDRDISRAVSRFFNFVPYRLLSPFFPELVGIEAKKNREIVRLSVDPRCLYVILDETKEIVIHEGWFEYIQRNYTIVAGWVHLRLIQYLQKRNPNTPGIPFKLVAPQHRNLSHASQYWKSIIDLSPLHDIYTNLPFTPETYQAYGRMSIDHFLPWSFVLHDQVWNLVPTFQTINSSKSDSLPALEAHLDRFCNIQATALETALRHSISTKLLKEEYHAFIHPSAFKDVAQFNRELFARKLAETIRPLHTIAANQGFPPWQRGPMSQLERVSESFSAYQANTD